MSYLKPHVPGTDQVKDVADYSEGEKLSAINEIHDSQKKTIFEGKQVNEQTRELVSELEKGTEKEGTLPEELTREKQTDPSGLGEGQSAPAQGRVPDLDEDTGTTRGRRNK